jgi:hypothetical protein
VVKKRMLGGARRSAGATPRRVASRPSVYGNAIFRSHSVGYVRSSVERQGSQSENRWKIQSRHSTLKV